MEPSLIEVKLYLLGATSLCVLFHFTFQTAWPSLTLTMYILFHRLVREANLTWTFMDPRANCSRSSYQKWRVLADTSNILHRCRSWQVGSSWIALTDCVQSPYIGTSFENLCEFRHVSILPVGIVRRCHFCFRVFSSFLWWFFGELPIGFIDSVLHAQLPHAYWML